MSRLALLGPDGSLVDRPAALAVFEYGPAWDRAGAISDRVLASHIEQVADGPLRGAEHWRWRMFRHFARNHLRVHDAAQLALVLALDTAEAGHRWGVLHSIAHLLAREAGLPRRHIDLVAAHDVGPERRAFERHLLRSALAAEEHEPPPERPNAMRIRRATASGERPSEVLRALGITSPLEAMLELSSAWRAKLAELDAAAALVRGDLSAMEADLALEKVAATHAGLWQLGLRIGEALARDQLDEETIALAKVRGIETLILVMHMAELPLGAAKAVTARIGAMGQAALARGVPSAVIAEERALAQERRAR